MYIVFFSCLFLTSAQCPSTFSTSSSPNTLREVSPGVYTPSSLVTTPSGWVTLPGANWIWESDSHTNGPFTFVNNFFISAWSLASLTSVKLTIAADDYYEITFNGVVIAPQWSGSYTYLSYYELKPWVVGSSALLGSQENSLKMKAWSHSGPAGLVYKLDVVY